MQKDGSVNVEIFIDEAMEEEGSQQRKLLAEKKKQISEELKTLSANTISSVSSHKLSHLCKLLISSSSSSIISSFQTSL